MGLIVRMYILWMCMICILKHGCVCIFCLFLVQFLSSAFSVLLKGQQKRNMGYFNMHFLLLFYVFLNCGLYSGSMLTEYVFRVAFKGVCCTVQKRKRKLKCLSVCCKTGKIFSLFIVLKLWQLKKISNSQRFFGIFGGGGYFMTRFPQSLKKKKKPWTLFYFSGLKNLILKCHGKLIFIFFFL